VADGLAPVAVVGLHGGEWFGRRAGAVLSRADVLIGAPRHFDGLRRDAAPGLRVPLWAPLVAVLDEAERHRQDGQRVCLIASGDPGFFGIVRTAAARFGHDGVDVHPAPSAVALAFARLGTNWDDAVVVSAHGRPLDEAVRAVLASPKVAVLTSPEQPPEALGRALVAAGCGARTVAVCSRLGSDDEAVATGGLGDLAGGAFDPLSVVVLSAAVAAPDEAGLRWGLADGCFDHRGGMVTKAEVRAVALGKLALPPTGVLWDVGAGSGSVAAECARLAPGLRIYAVERRADDVDRLRRNVAGTVVTVVEGEAPGVLAGLPAPDRAFVGGGGPAVLDAVLDRLRPDGTVVATYAALDRAAAAAAKLGHLVQVAVGRGTRVGPNGAFRLEAENPVFVCWGPGE
jgi:precorrin-6Y C5,15-methyltransferase (decarboxylating)